MKMGKDGEPESVGQLLDDLGNFINNGYAGYKWVFTPDVIPNSRVLDKLPDKSALEEYRNKMIDYLEDSLDDERIIYLMEKNGSKPQDIKNDKLRKSFKEKLFRTIESEAFFDVADFEKIVKGK